MSDHAVKDQPQRQQILEALERNLLVEAAAGTGKTTSMVGRMVALLRSGHCASPHQLAAVTFTRKAAAELRQRFAVAARRALDETPADSADHRRLARVVGQLDGCFIGTIHAFCARLLRERPVEAGVDAGFVELDEAEDRALRRQAWQELTATVVAEQGPGSRAEALRRLGLRLDQLRHTFERCFADYADVERWPAPVPARTDYRQTAAALREYGRRMAALGPRLPAAPSPGDGLAATYLRLPRILAHYQPSAGGDPLVDDPARLMEILARLEPRAVNAVQRDWHAAGGFSADEVKAELAALATFREQVVGPQLAAWRARRQGPVIELLGEARRTYDQLRRQRGALSYQDLLLGAARLLREHVEVRRYFARRLSHLLIDEFQDTDPVQAEVTMLLCAEDPGERRWRRCRPRPGSLFVVGDPKQSIYRFRRADIVTYSEVKQLITDGGGRVVELSTNFRAAAPVINWINETFNPAFPDRATAESPAYVPLEPSPASREASGGDLAGVARLSIPKQHSATKAAVIRYEATRIARTIRQAIEAGLTVARRAGDPTSIGPAQPDDFMIVTRKRADLSAYAAALAAEGVPHQVTGGAALNELPGLRLLQRCLTAVLRPDDPVALVGTLRSELFGVSDAELYAFKRAGGVFRWDAPLPATLAAGRGREALEDALGRLRRYARWVDHVPPVVALAAVAEDLGLPALAAAGPGGDQAAGSLGKSLELLRARARRAYCLDELVERLDELVAGEEAHDGTSGVGHAGPVVRVMNLHKVKGLEAPVVFLADPTGEAHREIELHIDRAGSETLGYLAAYEPRGHFAPALLAHPIGWAEHRQREARFAEAEELRLRYVATTRAAALLVISERASGEAASPWRALPLDRLPELELPGLDLAALDLAGLDLSGLDLPGALATPAVDRPATSSLTLGRAFAAERALADRWDRARRPTHAERRLVAEPRLRQRAVAHLRRAPIWRRAAVARERLTAVPYVLRVEDADQGPMLVRGVVDLAFREPDGWVLVSLRSGAAGSARVARQARNLGHAAEAWGAATGEPVSARLLCAEAGEDLAC